MRLIAIKWICDQTPEGAAFEVPDADGRLLIELGLAREDVPAAVTPEAPRARRTYRRADLTTTVTV